MGKPVQGIQVVSMKYQDRRLLSEHVEPKDSSMVMLANTCTTRESSFCAH